METNHQWDERLCLRGFWQLVHNHTQYLRPFFRPQIIQPDSVVASVISQHIYCHSVQLSHPASIKGGHMIATQDTSLLSLRVVALIPLRQMLVGKVGYEVVETFG